MSSNILKCRQCGKYTLSQTCQVCGVEAITPHPPKFSPEDRYGKYRRELQALTRKGE